MKQLFSRTLFCNQEVGHFHLDVMYVGGYLATLDKTICYMDAELKCYDKNGKYVLTLPFSPTFKKVDGRVDAEWFICNEITEKENEKLNPCCTWNGGSSYSLKWNRESPFAWVMLLFPEELK